MDYFYNFIEFNNRSKLSEKERLELNEFIHSILGIYSQIPISSQSSNQSGLINQILILKIGLNILNSTQIEINNNENITKYYIIEKIIKLNILSGNYRGIEFIKKIIILEFFKGLKNQDSLKILKEKILSMYGDKYRRDYFIFEKSSEEFHGSILSGN